MTTVMVTRGWGSARACVPIRYLRGPHIAVHEGGRFRRLPHPMLGLYVTDCRVLPDGFGHDCAHGDPPHVVKVLVPRRGNDRDLYDRLWRSAGRVHYDRWRRRPIRAAGAATPIIMAFLGGG